MRERPGQQGYGFQFQRVGQFGEVFRREFDGVGIGRQLLKRFMHAFEAVAGLSHK